jgi:hypothetical protein
MPPAVEKLHLRGIDQARSAHAGAAPATGGAQTAGVRPPAQLVRLAPAMTAHSAVALRG